MVTNHRHSTITGKADGEERRGVRREEGREHDKGYAMVFGDNVRARRAARALPRTPITRGRRGKRREEENKATRPHTLTRPPTRPALQHGHRANGEGGADIHERGMLVSNGRVSITAPALHSPCHPTIHNGPTHHHDEGGVDRGYPTTRTPQTHTHHPHTTHR